MSDIELLLATHLERTILEQETVKVHTAKSDEHEILIRKSSASTEFRLEYLHDSIEAKIIVPLIEKGVSLKLRTEYEKVGDYSNTKKDISLC